MSSPATNKTDSAGLATQLKTFYDRTLLQRMLPNLVYAMFGQSRPMPQREGQTVSFRKFSSLSAATTPLSEGVTPDGSLLTSTAITATPVQYGDYVKVTDLVSMTSFDPVLTETAELLGEQAADTIDQLVRDVVYAGTTIQYAGGHVAREDVHTTLSAAEIALAVRTMHTNKAKKLTSIVNGSTGVGTKPIDASFVGIIGPKTLYDLKNDAKWIPVQDYASTQALLPFEVGACDEVRFVLSHNAKVWEDAGAGSVDVHGTLILGANAYGVVTLAGVENIIKPLGSGDDPLNQRQTSGWKALFTAVILNQLAMLRIEHAVTA